MIWFCYLKQTLAVHAAHIWHDDIWSVLAVISVLVGKCKVGVKKKKKSRKLTHMAHIYTTI